MKYLFADSTAFPLQKDFLETLDNFIDTSAKTISLENTVFDLKENVKDRRLLKNSVLEEMDSFILTLDRAISDAVSRSKEKEAIAQHADKSKFFLKKFIDDGKKDFSDEIFHEIAGIEEEIDKADEENRKTLESFFVNDPVLVKNKKYAVKALKKGYSAKVSVDYEKGISCVFEIDPLKVSFWDSHVKAQEFLKNVEIPVKMKKPLLKKEIVPDVINIDDYYLTNLDLSENNMGVVFRKKLSPKAERLRFKMNIDDQSSIKVFYAEENGVEKDILAVPELRRETNFQELHELGGKIAEKAEDLYSGKQKLESLKLDDKDVFIENLMFDLMVNVAEVFAPTVAKIKEHSSSKEELALKVEDDTGKRSEIYLKKSKVKEKLSEIKEKGDRLLQVMGI